MSENVMCLECGHPRPASWPVCEYCKLVERAERAEFTILDLKARILDLEKSLKDFGEHHARMMALPVTEKCVGDHVVDYNTMVEESKEVRRLVEAAEKRVSKGCQPFCAPQKCDCGNWELIASLRPFRQGQRGVYREHNGKMIKEITTDSTGGPK